MGVEIVGPFQERRLVVDGWQVPFVDAWERDDGSVEFVFDKRLAYTVGPAEFEIAAHLIATAYAIGIGLTCFPNDEALPDGDDDARVRFFAGVPFPMRPRRLIGMASFDAGESS